MARGKFLSTMTRALRSADLQRLLREQGATVDDTSLRQQVSNINEGVASGAAGSALGGARFGGISEVNSTTRDLAGGTVSAFNQLSQQLDRSGGLPPAERTRLNLGGDIAFAPGTALPATGSGGTLQSAISGAGSVPTATQAQNPLIAQVQSAQSRSVRDQQAGLQQAPAGREAIFNASPQLRQASQALLQQAQDPGGGGFREDFQERIRVQQAAAGLSGGGQAAFQEAALTAGALGQRRQQAATQLQGLGGNILQQLGLGSPVVADLAGIGQTALAGQTLGAIQAANEAQAAQSQQLFNLIYGNLFGGVAPNSPTGVNTQPVPTLGSPGDVVPPSSIGILGQGGSRSPFTI